MNGRFFEINRTARTKQVLPALDPAAAIDRARAYCQAFKMQPGRDFQLTVVSFDDESPLCWEICWSRYSGGYPWEDYGSLLHSESFAVVFHETEGLQMIADRASCPEPKNLDVKVTREIAIVKASKCVGLVQQTPFYRRSRMDGFVATAVRSCELRVTAPNWLLDPKRVVWPGEGPPEETRLCWVVSFATVDAKAEERGLKSPDGKPRKLIPPDIIIHIDAATGEVVGAGFK